MTTNRRIHSPFFAAVLLFTLADPGVAQQMTSEEVRRELADLRAEMRQLRAELDAMRDLSAPRYPVVAVQAKLDATSPGAAPVSFVQPAQTGITQPSLELLQTQVAELAQVKVESTSRMPVKVFGTIHTNVFANSGDPNWLDRPNIVNPAPVDGQPAAR